MAAETTAQYRQVAGIPDHKIRDRDSFKETTLDDSRHLAGLYFFMVLDRLVYLAEWLSYDFFERPQKYTDLDDEVVDLLAELHASSGSNKLIPSTKQRYEIYVPIFGL